MKTVGIIGGMSWESSLEYYKTINEIIANKLGSLHSGQIILHSVDFAIIEKLQHDGDWDSLGKIMADTAILLEQSGADFIAIATNTMHKLAHHVTTAVNIPLLHIADATAIKIRASNIKKIGLLGTQFTMEQSFYKDVLINDFDLDVLVPSSVDREIIHQVIYDELCKGEIKESSKQEFMRIINLLQFGGVDGVILGCTEIELLIKPSDCSIPTFPTAKIHAEAIADYMLS